MMGNRVIYPPMSPAVSYYGGKQRLASRIVEQALKIPHTVYCEPYCGGAAVYFAMPIMCTGNNDHYRVVLNDIDERLITFYRVAQTRTDELLMMLKGTLYSKAEHARSVLILQNLLEHDDLEIAWAYFVKAGQSFASVVSETGGRSGWGRCVFGRNDAAVWDSTISKLPMMIEKLSICYVDCIDALRCIDKWDSSQTLFYCDPPYTGTESKAIKEYSIEQWAELCSKLDSIQGSYILSNYPQTVEPASAQQRIEIQVTMSASCKGKTNNKNRSRKAMADELGNRERTEVLWICDRSANARDELKPVFKRLQAALTKPEQTDLFAAMEVDQDQSAA